jgi:transcription elongation factor Elf1
MPEVIRPVEWARCSLCNRLLSFEGSVEIEVNLNRIWLTCKNCGCKSPFEVTKWTKPER